MSDAALKKHGKLYWRIVGEVGDIHLYADRVQFVDGAAIFTQGDELRFAAASGEWRHIYAASCLDGGAIAVEHWSEAKP